jgi:histone deacetylase HOS3
MAPKTLVLIQEASALHRFIRSTDASNIVERPERLRAVHLGISAALARLHEAFTASWIPSSADEGSSQVGILPRGAQTHSSDKAAEELADSFQKLHFTPSVERNLLVEIVHSTATLDLLQNAAVKFIHGDIDGDVYLENLINLARESQEKIAAGKSEIPEGLSQGDLYRK